MLFRSYLTIPNKNATGRPIQVWINRQSGVTGATTITLNQTLTAVDTTADNTITLSSTVGLPQFGFIKIGEETIQYGGISGSTITGCLRAVNNTSIAAHAIGSAIYLQNLPTINVWPAPDQSNFYTFVYYRLRRIQDAGNGVNVEDIPFRFIPAMVAGLEIGRAHV